MNMHEAMEFLDKKVLNPSSGLPKELFYFTS